MTVLSLLVSAPVPALTVPALAVLRGIRYYISYNMTPKYKQLLHLVSNCGKGKGNGCAGLRDTLLLSNISHPGCV